MKIFNVSTMLAVCAAVAAGALLFWTSLSVQQAQNKLDRLDKAVANEEQAIRVLHAEWDYLNRPDRLEYLADHYLDLGPAKDASNLTVNASTLPEQFVPALPVRKPDLNAQPVSAGQDRIDFSSMIHPASGEAPQ